MGMSVGAARSGRGGRGHRRRGRHHGLMSEINVTPFVDVMLVLLIIFMVAAPLLTVGVPIELPKTAAAPLPTEQEEPLTIAMTADGQILVQNISHSNEHYGNLVTYMRIKGLVPPSTERATAPRPGGDGAPR